jgi:glycosyltransferase involved in cell wall biosynthesis
MRALLVADTFPPLRTSGAVQLRDFSLECVRQGHAVTMLVADPAAPVPAVPENYSGVRVVRLKTPQTKDMNHIRRFFGELVMPFAMVRGLRGSALAAETFDVVIWYSPTIFLGPLVRWLKRRSRCPSYLILRDIFPEWALDMGILKRGLAFNLLRAVANYQYRSADVIGVQTPGNIAYFDDRQKRSIAARVEVLDNWLGEEPVGACSIDIAATPLKGRRIFVYTGNMGVAQDMDKILRLAAGLKARTDIGFVFVGRGSDVGRLRELAKSLSLVNTLFFDEIAPEEIPGLLSQCHVGVLCLDGRHKTHNIPGKFLAYMRAGLPVLASVNAGNDLVQDIETHQVGLASIDMRGDDLAHLARELVSASWSSKTVTSRCRSLFEARFSARAAVAQIAAAVGFGRG